jgi:hypothetical protein
MQKCVPRNYSRLISHSRFTLRYHLCLLNNELKWKSFTHREIKAAGLHVSLVCWISSKSLQRHSLMSDESDTRGAQCADIKGCALHILTYTHVHMLFHICLEIYVWNNILEYIWREILMS